MRFLCLHGRGTNSAIFEFQSETICALLPDHYSYFVPDAECPCSPAPGLGKLVQEPCACWYPDDSLKSVAGAHELISEIIEDEGPFDAVIGFSQGAALAASLLLHHQIAHPLAPPLFRVAIFISAFRPFSRDPMLGKDITGQPETFTPTAIDEPLDRCQWLDPATLKERIRIPTAHIYGKSDPWLNQAQDMVELSDGNFANVFVHHGGHEIPIQPDICKGIRDVIVRAVDRSETFQ